MKLNELYATSFRDALAQMDINDLKVHTDDDGEIKSIEIRYVPEGFKSPIAPRRQELKAQF